MKYKLICVDLDGTLLDKDGKITRENKAEIKKAYKNGIKIAITTGRRYPSAKQHLDLLEVEGMIIALNGAYIRGKVPHEFIYECPLEEAEVEQIFEVVLRYQIKALFSSVNDFILYDPASPCTKDWLERIRGLSGKILKVSLVCEENAKIIANARTELEMLKQFEVVTSEVNYVEVMKQGCSKGAAVRRLAQVLGIEQREILCIGDNENDISMINYAGCGIAMGNACEVLKQAADFITDTNTNSGVAKAIYKMLRHSV